MALVIMDLRWDTSVEAVEMKSNNTLIVFIAITFKINKNAHSGATRPTVKEKTPSAAGEGWGGIKSA